MDERDGGRTLVAALPAAAAIVVFGVIYGSLAREDLGTGATILSSLVIFSGSVQFTVAALVASGAGAAAVVAGALGLNLRNLVLGAVLRPRVRRSRGERALIAWFLTDEAAGLALTSRDSATSVLVKSGALFYVSWQIGTILGIAGASVDAVSDAAEAVFPVLFIGLAAAACTSWSIAARASVAAVGAGAAAWLWPEAAGVIAVAAAIAVALPERAR